ncbi:MAG: quinolinate synthase NadA [Acholeplasmatales bacterium]|nr:quinolinate synthase NadA [Acholeplasmatales bacterium]
MSELTKEEMYEDIRRWKKEKNAVILAHYYQIGDIQDIADYVGDSLALAQTAAKTDADIIVFCGVHFMAETAKLLSPNKKVLLPVMEAGCVMANMMDEAKIKKYREDHPDTVILMYVNSTAACKQYADVCVTSSNAMKIIDHYSKQGKPMLYGPDKNLGAYAMTKSNVKLDLWPGFCGIHNGLKPEVVDEMKAKYPNAEFIAHPECNLNVLAKADYIGSTKQLIEYVTKSDKKEFIIGTEGGVIHAMEKKNPDKKFYLLSDRLNCFEMKLTRLYDLWRVLRDEDNVIEIPEDLAKRAVKCVDKMLELS